MRRREFITLISGAAAWPVAARAQQPAIPVIGWLSSASPSAFAERVVAFRQGLREAGYIEGENVHIAFRWAEGRYDRLPALAAELVQSKVGVIAASGGLPSAVAAKAATATIPIAFIASDPVRSGLVASLNRPGGNLSGVSPLSALLEAKRLGLLRELVPSAAVIGVLSNPNYSDVDIQLNDIQEAARTLGQQIRVVNASSERDIDAGIASIVQQRAGALLVQSDPFFTIRREQIVALTARYALPAIYGGREFAAAGGLVSYAPSFTEAYRLLGIYTGRILKGEKPAELPIIQSTKFEFVLNLKTAKAIALDIPPTLLARADEVIE
jgi:putative ABC transport system substrate-binding protein